jgi:hypothetical protein
MRAGEKCGVCPQELDVAREDSGLRVVPGFAKLSWRDAKDLEPGNERARLSAEFAK